MIQPLMCGVSRSDTGFLFDFEHDTNEDIIRLMDITPIKSEFDGHLYCFGYTFTNKADSKDSGDFMRWIKAEASKPQLSYNVERFLIRPITKLRQSFNIMETDALVYPLSNRNELDVTLGKIIGYQLPNSTEMMSFGLVKNLPENVTFNFKRFERDFSSETDHDKMYAYRQMRRHIIRNVLPSFKTVSYFSLADMVKVKYRPYIENYLTFGSDRDKEAFTALAEGSNVIVMDEANTTGTVVNSTVPLSF